MLIIGLTGNIACGKSTVARQLAGYGARVIDADALVHELYEDRTFAARVAGLFSPEVLQADGMVDRKALGAIVFSDPVALKRLEELVHPAVAARRDAVLQDLRAMPVKARPPVMSRPPAVVLEAVKLVESGQAAVCAEVWCITCDPEVQLRRMMERRGLSREAAAARLKSQPSLAGKRALLGPIRLVELHNDGTLLDLERQVAHQWKMLCG